VYNIANISLFILVSAQLPRTLYLILENNNSDKNNTGNKKLTINFKFAYLQFSSLSKRKIFK
jgi:hypothetical protein